MGIVAAWDIITSGMIAFDTGFDCECGMFIIHGFAPMP